MPAPDDRKATRTPITLKIKFKSSSLDQFIERYSVDVSRGGIFIRTKEPLPVGTTLRFEFQLQDGSSLIGGEGTVVWNRAFDPARTGVAPGMGVRFDKLTADSQRVLDRILSEKHKRGEAQLESRFDAGVRASREVRPLQDFPDAGTPLPKPVPGMGAGSSPGQGQSGTQGSFGDEPTKMMAADQVSQLAEAMQHDDGFDKEQPTRRATMDEIRRAVLQTVPSNPQPGLRGAEPRFSGMLARPPESRNSGMGMVNPVLARATQPSSSSQDDIPLPSNATRPVTLDEVSSLIAASRSDATPPSLDPRASSASPYAKAPPREAPVVATPTLRDEPISDFADERMLDTVVDAQVPTIPQVPVEDLLTASSPPPPPVESASFLAGGESGRAAAAPPSAAAASTGSPPSGISIGLDDLIDNPSVDGAPSKPLDPREFALADTEPRGAMSPATGAGKAAPSEDRPSEEKVEEGETARTRVRPAAESTTQRPSVANRWVAALLTLAVVVTGGTVYSLMTGRRVGTEIGPTQPEVPLEPKVLPGPGPNAAGQKPAPPALEPARDPAEPGSKEPAEPARPPPNVALVAIHSDPAGAKVEQLGKEGKELGTTPLEVQHLPPGKLVEIKLSHHGFQDKVVRVRPVAGERKTVELRLTPYERVVEIVSAPRNAEVLLDGRKAGRTPLILRRMDMSTIRTIEVRKNGYLAQQRKVSDNDTFEVRGGRMVLPLSLTLEAAPEKKAEQRDASAKEAREPARREVRRPPRQEPAQAREPDEGKAQPPREQQKKDEKDKTEERGKEGRPDGVRETRPEDASREERQRDTAPPAPREEKKPEGDPAPAPAEVR